MCANTNDVTRAMAVALAEFGMSGIPCDRADRSTVVGTMPNIYAEFLLLVFISNMMMRTYPDMCGVIRCMIRIGRLATAIAS